MSGLKLCTIGGWDVATGAVGDTLRALREVASNDNLILSGANTIRLDTSSSTRMTIAQSGNVGIGTLAPSATLEVIGDSEFGSDGIKVTSRNGVSGVYIGYGGLASINSNSLRLGCNNDEKMCIDNNGYVGIGTSVPSVELEVYPNQDISANIGKSSIGYFGNIGGGNYVAFGHYDNKDTLNFALLSYSGGNTILNCPNNQEIIFSSANNTKAFMNSDGNFSLSSSFSDCKLSLFQAFSPPSLNQPVVDNPDAGFGFYTKLSSSWNGSGVFTQFIAETIGSRIWYAPVTYAELNPGTSTAGHHGRLNFSCGYDSVTADDINMTLTSFGNVGIGTSTPGNKLTVEGIIEAANSGSTVRTSISSNYGNFASIECFDATNSTKYPVNLCAYGGNVGIGTTNPGVKLDVLSGDATVIQCRSSGSHSIMGFQTSTSTASGYVGYYNGNVELQSPTGIALWQSNGVGVGWGNGNGRALYINGVTHSTGGYTSSDDRIKYNEQDLDDDEALNLINQLQPQKYEKIIEQPKDATGTWIPTDAEWNNGAKDNFKWYNEAGLIAQDVKAIPELAWTVDGEEVDAEGNQTPLTVNYNDIYAYHIAATKALYAKIQALEARIQTLENP